MSEKFTAGTDATVRSFFLINDDFFDVDDDFAAPDGVDDSDAAVVMLGDEALDDLLIDDTAFNEALVGIAFTGGTESISMTSGDSVDPLKVDF